ncbi:hypothetical protein [Devosia alba]|uniref:hypothetical protein n=1 Tax=Devosia alba TaxID=3152360 RepID=UPI00326425CD
MTDGPRVVPMQPKDDMKAASDMLRRMAPELMENAKTIARIRRASYLAHVAEGFTEAQALELCKSMAM